MKFSDVVGLEDVKRKLIKSVNNNKVSHANLFLGNEGTGGLPLALAFAQYINCNNRKENDSCGECSSCKKSEKLIHPDFHYTYPVINTPNNKKPVSEDYINEWRSAILENPYLTYTDWLVKLKAENKQGNIYIEECHRIIKNLSLKAYSGKNKFQIIWLPEYLGKAGNSLLKIIEEPTANTYFIFVAQIKDKILNTIISRMQTTLLPPLNHDVISDKLTTSFGVEHEEAINIAHLSNGNYSEAYSLYQKGQNDHAESFIEWMRMCYLFEKDPKKIYDWINKTVKEGREYLKDFLKYGIRIIREAFLLGNELEDITHLSKSEQDFAIKFSPFVNSQTIQEIYELLNKGHYYIERNANSKIVIFNLSLQFKRIFKQVSIKQK